MNVDVSDADLVHRVASGDRDAEATVCLRMAPRIRLYGLRHLRSPAAADDLMQQVLLKTLEALRAGRLHDMDKLPQFVLGTCRMTVLDQRRTAQRQGALLQEFGDVLVRAQRDTPPLDGERLARCVQGLKERERTVVVMAFYDERTAVESGQALGLSEANVRVIRHRALRQLRTCMGAAS